MLFEGRVAFVMFFVLSGYLLYRPFARAALGQGEPRHRAQLSGAASRAYPARLLRRDRSGRCCCLGRGRRAGPAAVDAGKLPLFFVFGQNYSPDTLLKLNAATWTLAVEVAFYLMLPRDRLAGAARVPGQGGRQARAARRARGGGPRLERARLRRRLGPGRRALAAVVPAVLRVRDAGRAAGRVAPLRGSAPLGRGASAALVARRGRVLVANGWWHATGRARQRGDGGAGRLRRGARVRRDDRRAGAGHRHRAALDGRAPAGVDGRDHLRLLPVAHPADRLRARPRPAAGRRCCPVVVLPVAIAFGAASWYWSSGRSCAAPRGCRARAERVRGRRSRATAARSARSRSRIPAHSGSRPASSSGRAAAARQ